MPTYSYVAKDATGRPVEGTLTAENQRIVLTRLDEMGLFPVEVRVTDVAQEAARSAGAGGRVKAADLCTFTRELADLLAGGVPLSRGLDTLSRQASHAVLNAVVLSIKNEVNSGCSLGDAMAMHPQVFPTVYVNMVRAGEEGGFLDDALVKLAEFLERQQELISRVKSAMIYPALLLTFGFAAVVFLVTFAVPVLAETFREMGGSLPWATRSLMAMSDFLRAHWLPLAVAVAVLVLGFRQALHTDAGRRAFDELKLRVPVVSRVMLRLSISRFARTLGTLLSSGVPILNALTLSKESTGNRVYAEAIEAASEQVRAGEPLGAQLARHRCFPPVLVDMVTVGEESGNLGPCLLRIAERNERDLDNAVRVFVSVLEPCILIVLGLFVLYIVLAMLLPVFTMNALVT